MRVVAVADTHLFHDDIPQSRLAVRSYPPPEARALFECMHYLEDSECRTENLRFYGSPWQPAFHDWRLTFLAVTSSRWCGATLRMVSTC